ncbi:MAG: WS/DGAT domain-containing protein [Acidimicrobiia bacterium]|nr:WS/DGAT domain-containing protein [Acidimicrobiia bacterium]
MKVADRHRPLFNVTISNVPGPPFPLYVAGAEVVSTNPIGPIFDAAELNITVMSYMDRLDFGLLACRAYWRTSGSSDGASPTPSPNKKTAADVA